MKEGKLAVSIRMGMFDSAVEAALISKSASGRMMVGRVVMEEVDPNTIIDESFKLDSDAARDLLDQLWRLGYRPQDWRGDDSQTLAAVREHLQDMRHIGMRAVDDYRVAAGLRVMPGEQEGLKGDE